MTIKKYYILIYEDLFFRFIILIYDQMGLKLKQSINYFVLSSISSNISVHIELLIVGSNVFSRNSMFLYILLVPRKLSSDHLRLSWRLLVTFSRTKLVYSSPLLFPFTEDGEQTQKVGLVSGLKYYLLYSSLSIIFGNNRQSVYNFQSFSPFIRQQKVIDFEPYNSSLKYFNVYTAFFETQTHVSQRTSCDKFSCHLEFKESQRNFYYDSTILQEHLERKEGFV